jgi:hypothetical protein
MSIGLDAPMTDEEWEAHSDARTLAEASLIRGDSGRMVKAQEAARKISEKADEEKEAMKRIAQGRLMFPNSPEMFKS